MNNTIRQQIEAVTASISRTNELYGRWAKKHGLNYNSLMTIYAIHTNDTCTQKQICDEWLIPKQTVNTVCTDLANQLYIYFEPHSKDKRIKVIKLTSLGREYAESILRDLYVLEERVMQQMGEEMCEWFVKSNAAFCHLFEVEVENE